MAALTADRNTPVRTGEYAEHPVAAGKKIYAGALVVLNATGYAEPGVTAANVVAIGRAEEQVDNSGGADGDVSVRVRRGIFRYANDGTNTIARTNIGGTAYVVDDQTVASTNGGGTRSAAGEVVDVDSDGAWVWIK